MVQAASTFRKSGFNDEDAATLAEVAATFQNVADTALSADDAAASIISQLRAYGETAEWATHIVLNIYINSIVVLTVVLTPQSITTNTINSTLSSHSVFFFHTQQYNSHHFLSIFLIFKIIKTSFYPFIYSLSYFIISYNLEISNLIIHIHQNFERIFLRIEKR